MKKALLIVFIAAILIVSCKKTEEPQTSLEKEVQEIEVPEQETTSLDKVEKEVEEAVTEISNATQERPKETILKEGQFKIQNVVTYGTVLVVEREGKKYVVFERFSTTPFPQTNVYLSMETTSNPAIFTKKGINLGPLKAEKEEQEYQIPDDTMIEIYRAVILYTPKKNAVLAYAPINPILK
ncbi:MAG: DM13 domain-containing protein [Candidatus Woesearchaeota archaeon]